MAITQQSTGEGTATLVVEIKKDDYLKEWNDSLKSYRKNAQIKGFRKGQAPMSFIKKMHGQASLAEKVNELIQQSIDNYIKDEKLALLGYPILSDEHDMQEINASNPEDYTFHFDIGMAPEIKLSELSNVNVEKYTIDIPESMIDEEIEAGQKRLGERINVDGPIEEDDMVVVHAQETDEDGKILKDGWATEFSVLVSSLADGPKETLVGKDKEFNWSFNINELEPNRDEAYVSKYLLNRTEADADVVIGNHFSGTVKEIKRMELAELNEDFFIKLFGEKEGIKDEKTAREKMREQIEKYYDEQAQNLAHHAAKDALVAAHPVTLPESFLKKFLATQKEDATADEIDHQLSHMREDLHWSLIDSELMKKFEIEVNGEEMLEEFKNQIRGYFGGQADDAMIESTAQSMMGNKEYAQKVYEELRVKRLFSSLLDQVNIEEKPIDMDGFKEVVQDVNQKLQAHNH